MQISPWEQLIIEPKSELQNSWQVLLRIDDAKIGCPDRGAWGSKLDVVEQVENLGAELNVHFSVIADREILEQRAIPIRFSRSAQLGVISGLVSEGKRRRLSKASGVEPVVQL